MALYALVDAVPDGTDGDVSSLPVTLVAVRTGHDPLPGVLVRPPHGTWRVRWHMASASTAEQRKSLRAKLWGGYFSDTSRSPYGLYARYKQMKQLGEPGSPLARLVDRYRAAYFPWDPVEGEESEEEEEESEEEEDRPRRPRPLPPAPTDQRPWVNEPRNFLVGLEEEPDTVAGGGVVLTLHLEHWHAALFVIDRLLSSTRPPPSADAPPRNYTPKPWPLPGELWWAAPGVILPSARSVYPLGAPPALYLLAQMAHAHGTMQWQVAPPASPRPGVRPVPYLIVPAVPPALDLTVREGGMHAERAAFIRTRSTRKEQDHLRTACHHLTSRDVCYTVDTTPPGLTGWCVSLPDAGQPARVTGVVRTLVGARKRLRTLDALEDAPAAPPPAAAPPPLKRARGLMTFYFTVRDGAQ